jgi:hypothetical protein
LAFAKLKTHLRGVARRTTAALVEAIGAGLTQVSAADATAWYQHCGYPVVPNNDQPL